MAGHRVYELHGLLVQSEFPLMARVIDRAHRRADYVVVEGRASDRAENPPLGRTVAEVRFPDFRFSATENAHRPGHWTLRFEAVADVVVDRQSGTITVFPDSAEARPYVPILVEGNLVAYLLATEGELTLHASAVEARGSALAVAGGSGAGKSTVAALLCGAGARLVSDDIVRVSLDDEPPGCYLGSGMLRLRPGVAALADRIQGARMTETADGRVGVIPPRATQRLLPISAVLAPELSPEARELAMERLGRRDGFVELLNHPRLTGWRKIGPIQAHFDGAHRLAGVVPIYRATIPGPPFQAGLGQEILDAVGMPQG